MPVLLFHKQDVQKKLVKFIAKTTAYDPENRFRNMDVFLYEMGKCPEFYGMCKENIFIGERGQVEGVDIWSDEKKDFFFLGYNGEKSEIISDNNATVILDNVYFGRRNKDTSMSAIWTGDEEIYLIRESNNERITICKNNFLLGKDKQYVDYPIDNNLSVSRRHTLIGIEQNGVYVMDLGSANGTFLNSVKIIPYIKNHIKHGDHIRVATEEFIFFCQNK